MSVKPKLLRKMRERFLLEQFIQTMALAAEIEEEREAPDFLVRVECRLVGIEVTEIFISHDTTKAIQAQESISDRIIFRASQRYYESGGAPAHVSVCFSSGTDLRRLNRDAAAEALALLIRGFGLTPWQRSDYRPEEADDPLLDYIAFIHTLGVPSKDMAHWVVARSGWAAPLTKQALRDRIEVKARRLASYRSAVPENWLLLVADRTRPSQLFALDAGIDAASVATPFSRAFFYFYPEKHILELGSQAQQA